MFKKLCRVVKTLPPLIKLFSFNRKGFLQNLEKTKKPKNQNFLEKFWFQVKRWFFLVFLEFFWFFLVFKNLNQKKPKKLKENQKKPSFDLKPKLLQKVLVFWFFGFLEVSFGFKNLNQKKQKNSRKTKKNNLLT